MYLTENTGSVISLSRTEHGASKLKTAPDYHGPKQGVSVSALTIDKPNLRLPSLANSSLQRHARLSLLLAGSNSTDDRVIRFCGNTAHSEVLLRLAPTLSSGQC